MPALPNDATPRARGRLLKVREAAEQLRVDESTVYRQIRRGFLPAVQIGGRRASLRLDEDELNAWLRAWPPEDVA
jgi:excisionase family DNA binding protein